jgi:uncharacterized membrane protein
MTLKTILRWPFAALFIASGVLHFTRSEVYLRLMPPYLPAPAALVALSGAIEGALGALLLLPATRRPAAWALIATLIAIFPANVYGATTAGTDQPAMPGVPIWAAWLRLPLQAALIAWAYWYTRADRRG